MRNFVTAILYTYIQDGNTALHLSTMGKDTDAVRLLLSYSLQCINLANKVNIVTVIYSILQ